MSVINSFFDLFTRRKDSSFIYDLDLFQDIKNRAYLKRMAIDTVINYVGRAVSQSEFRVMNKGLPVKDAMYYKLNVRPNTDESASDFWQHFVYQLIYYNEVLVIQDDNGDLLIADDFSRHEYAVYEDTFDNVTVKEYTFKRSFPMSDVIYLRYSNDQLEHYLTGLWGDYGELFGRMYELELRNNQIRATVKADLMTVKPTSCRSLLTRFSNLSARTPLRWYQSLMVLSITKCQTVWVRTRHLMKTTAC
jgi:HK97 family phage portal protein